MNHQKLKCYVVLTEKIAKRVPDLVASLPRGEGYLVDQLKRALSSAILNLSEGNSRISRREKCRFFDISIASIAEVSSVIDIMSAYGYLQKQADAEIKSYLNIAYAMIVGLKRRFSSL